MANSTTGLTDTQIKRAKKSEREYNLADGKGLQLRVKPSGLKIWLFNYARPITKKRTNLKVGEYPDLSLQAARNKRQELRALLAEGIDPQAHQAELKAIAMDANASTFKAVADSWFEVKSHEISEDYAEDLYNSLVNHVFPYIGKLPIHTLKARQVIELLEPLQTSGKLELVKRLCQRINMIMDFAVIRGIVDNNSLSRISKAFKAPQKKHLPTLEPSELAELRQAIEQASVTTTTRNLIKWQLHTMVRPSEAAGAQWKEIDFDHKIWNIPSKRMKKSRAHSVPLTQHSLAILDSMRPISMKREFIFPSAKNPRGHANSSSVNVALKRMGYQGRLVAHGFRSLASTTLNEIGFDADVIETALAHIDKNSVRAAYNRAEYIKRRREMMDWWSAHVEAGLVS